MVFFPFARIRRAVAANISTYWLDPLSARGPRLEGIAEVLGLTSHLPVSEFHDAHRVRWQAVVRKDEFSDPKVGSTEYASHRKALLVRLRKTRCLNIASTVDSLSGLRVLKHGIVAVNLVLCLEIIRVRSCPVTIQSRSNGLVFIHGLPSRGSAGHGVIPQNGHARARTQCALRVKGGITHDQQSLSAIPPESGHRMNVHDYTPWLNRRGDTA